MKRIFSLLIVGLLATSCFNNDDDGGSGPNDPNDPGSTSHLVKTEIAGASTNIQYQYDDFDKLETWTSTYPGLVGFELNFAYNDDGTVFNVNYVDSDENTDQMGYAYDGTGKLIGYVGFGDSVTLTYNGNIITVSGTIEGDDSAMATIELNAQGRVVKFTESNQYTTFGYDSNGNLTNAIRLDLDDNVLNQFSLVYDSKPNPFNGQLNSIYLQRFLEFFWQFDGFYYTGMEGYNFPYNKNNLLSIIRDGSTILTYSMGYDNDGYPTAFSEIEQGTSFEFQITYY